MIGKSNLAVNEKPRIKAPTSTQGITGLKDSSKDNTSTQLKESRTRYQKGLAIYYQGRVSIGTDGRFIIDGFRVAPDRVSCECPEFRKDAIPCPHFYAASLFQKKGKPKTVTQKVAERNGHEKPSQIAPEKPQEAPGRDFNRHRVVTRLAVLNTATEILRSYNKPIKLNHVLDLASRLETWALGN